MQGYFQRLSAADNKLQNEQTAALRPQQINADNIIDDQEKQSIRESIDRILSALEAFRTAFAKLNPPPGIEAEHNEALTQLDGLIAAFRETSDRVQNAKSLDDLIAAFADADAAKKALTQACLALQKIAESNNIAVKLRC
ncbi:MAG TPA: hypothetical protein VNL15_02225 [Dehalococcoidia bacterium]|nr:hypothetical protein [Dehalococcoidia bacterium]